MSVVLVWIVLLPLCSFVLLGAMYLFSITQRRIAQRYFTFVALFSPAVVFVLGLAALRELMLLGHALHYRAYVWLQIGEYRVDMGFLGDKLSLFMVFFITLVGGLIHLYATSYMNKDEGYGKFFAYFHLFTACMLLLVLADGPLMLFIGWEGVGLCSYLLIGFYYQNNANVVAGNKAFIVNRVGDLGFLIGLAMLFFYGQSHDFSYETLALHIGAVPPEILTGIAVALFVGAMGKSAQIPLYVWLPDAMAGPTPVSALIHAATMVTAGVYMVARFHFLYDLVPHVGIFIAYIGALSAFFAALIATKQSDIKKILAYSTMSQLGYMFVSVGLGAYDSALFHVFTHAFFKALLFMGAGAVIVALHHEQDIFKMGEMRRVMPVTYATMLIATLAISGIPPFAGFFSKDEILSVAFGSGHYELWLIGTVTAALSSYYMFRLFFVVFEGTHASHSRAHDVDWVMKAPLIVLAVGATFAGFLGLPELFGGNHLIGAWLAPWRREAFHLSHVVEEILIVLNVVAALLGIAIAYRKFRFYDRRVAYKPEGIVYRKFYVDELYDVLFVQSIQRLSRFIAETTDKKLVDRVVMGMSRGFIAAGNRIAWVQNASVRLYAFIMIAGIGAASCYLLAVLR